MKNPINTFIDLKVSREFKPIVEKFRMLISKQFPILKEEMRGGTEKYYGIPVYRNKRIIISVSPTKQGITFAFTEGKMFEDKYYLLEGKGNKSLNLRIGTIEEYDDNIMSYYIKQAIEIDNEK